MKRLLIFLVCICIGLPLYAASSEGTTPVAGSTVIYGSSDGSAIQRLKTDTDGHPQVDVATIAAGDNNIGDVDVATIAAGDNNIGNMDIVTAPDITLANSCNAEVRAASGDLTAGETSTPVTGLGAYKSAIVRLDVTKLTLADGDDEVDFYVQTSYNGGADWADIENIHFDNADNGTTAIKLIVIGTPVDAPDAPIAETDGTLADDTQNDIPLGDRIRVKTTVTGATAPTYAYNAEACFKQ